MFDDIIALYPIDQTWLGVRCHPEGEFGHYYFHIAGLLRGQNPHVDQVTVAALLKYGQQCT